MELLRFLIIGLMAEAFLVALFLAAWKQFRNNDDLIINEKNEIIAGEVGPNPEVRQPRSQPTWYNK